MNRIRTRGVGNREAAGESVGRPSAEQGEIARLTRELEVTGSKLARTQTALEIMGKAHALLELLSESAEETREPGPSR